MDKTIQNLHGRTGHTRLNRPKGLLAGVCMIRRCMSVYSPVHVSDSPVYVDLVNIHVQKGTVEALWEVVEQVKIMKKHKFLWLRV